MFVAGLSLRPMAESDLFFRIKAGDEILARHGLPGRNLFSFTYPDYPDLDASWLFEVAVAGLYRHGGFPGIVIAKTALLLATFAAAYWLCRRRGAGPLASVLALAAAALVARERFVERPHLASLLGVVGALAAVDALFACTSRRALAGLLTGVFVGTSLWANLHAGVFVAPLLLAAAAGGAWLDRRRGGEGRAGPLALAALAAAAATLATPIGVGLLSYLRLHLILPALHPVDEFRSPTLTSDAAFVVFVPVAGAAVALAWLRAGARPAMRWLAPVLPLALLALKAVRFAPDLALAFAPLTAVALTALAASPARAGGLGAAAGGGHLRAAARPDDRPARDRARSRRASGSTRGSCRSPRSVSSTSTACATACTTTSRSGRTCCSIRRAIRSTACSSIRASPPIPPSCTGCSGATT